MFFQYSRGLNEICIWKLFINFKPLFKKNLIATVAVRIFGISVLDLFRIFSQIISYSEDKLENIRYQSQLVLWEVKSGKFNCAAPITSTLFANERFLAPFQFPLLTPNWPRLGQGKDSRQGWQPVRRKAFAYCCFTCQALPEPKYCSWMPLLAILTFSP